MGNKTNYDATVVSIAKKLWIENHPSYLAEQRYLYDDEQNRLTKLMALPPESPLRNMRWNAADVLAVLRDNPDLVEKAEGAQRHIDDFHKRNLDGIREQLEQDFDREIAG